MNFIDAHSHIWTPDTEKYPLAAGFRRANMEPLSFTAEELSQQAIPVGVSRVLLIQMSFYGYDNSYMLDMIAKRREMYRGVAVIEQDRGTPDGLMRELKSKGVRGFRIYPKDQSYDRWLSSETMRGMWRCGATERLAMCCLMDPNGLPALDKMCQQHPDTPVVIDHMCRIGVTGQISQNDVQALCDMAKHQRVFVKVSAFYALGQKKPPYRDLVPMIKRLCDAFGPQRLMWGSDAPFQVGEGHSYKASIDLMQSALDFLKPADLDWLLRGTAEKLFFE